MHTLTTIPVDDFNDLLHSLTEDLSEATSFNGPFARLVVRAEDTYRYCDFDLHLHRDSENDYVNRLHALGRFASDRQMPVVAVFVVGGGTFRPISEDVHLAYDALLVSGETADGLQGSAHALRAADGSLTPFHVRPSTSEQGAGADQIARFVYEGIRAHTTTREQLTRDRN